MTITARLSRIGWRRPVTPASQTAASSRRPRLPGGLVRRDWRTRAASIAVASSGGIARWNGVKRAPRREPRLLDCADDDCHAEGALEEVAFAHAAAGFPV